MKRKEFLHFFSYCVFKLILTCLIVFVNNLAFSKVEAPNYNFSLDSLAPFFPDSTLEKVQAVHGKGQLIMQDQGVELHRFYVAQIRYKFPVFVQVYQGRILDFWAKLPSYFSHDLYFQALINRFGKQNITHNADVTTVYLWNKLEGKNYYYSGSCTITCFPIYFGGKVESPPLNLLNYRSLKDQFRSGQLF